MMKANGRDARDVEIIVSPYTKKIIPDDLKKYRAAGVDELVLHQRLVLIGQLLQLHLHSQQ